MLICYTVGMSDLKERMRLAFSNMAATESLEDVTDAATMERLIGWGKTIAEQFVLRAKDMEDTAAFEYLAPYAGALNKMMRAMGQWVIEKDYEAQLEWWNRIEQNGKTLYSDRFVLPALKHVAQEVTNADTGKRLDFVTKLIENQKSKT